jgi:hypothetical protein
MKGLVTATATALLAAASTAAISTPALADTVVTRQTISTPFSATGLTDGCHPGPTGTIAGTDTVSDQSVQTADGFHVEGTDVASGRIDWSDGSLTIIGSTDHFAFNTTAATTLITDAHVDFGDNYSAEGVFLFHTTFHSASHFTVTNGVITRVAFDFNHNHVFGSDCSP